MSPSIRFPSLATTLVWYFLLLSPLLLLQFLYYHNIIIMISKIVTMVCLASLKMWCMCGKIS